MLKLHHWANCSKVITRQTVNLKHGTHFFFADSVYKFFYDENKNSKNADPPDISSVIGSLVEATWSDKDDVVRETISTALLQLSTPFSQLILQSIITFRKSHPKVSQE